MMVLKPLAILAAPGAMFLAELPLGVPQPNELFSWLACACAVMAMVALGKSIFWKSPADHERWADKKETNLRLKEIETKLDGIQDDVSGLPAKTIALLTDAQRLLARGGRRQ